MMIGAELFRQRPRSVAVTLITSTRGGMARLSCSGYDDRCRAVQAGSTFSRSYANYVYTRRDGQAELFWV